MKLYRVTARVSHRRWDDEGFIETHTVQAASAEEASETALSDLAAVYPTAWILTVSPL